MPKLTKRFVDALKPVSVDTMYRDSDLKGFALRAKSSGIQTWVVQYRNKAGRTRKLALGKVGVLTPEEARQQAKDALAAASKGFDPSADRHAERADLTVGELVERYLADGCRQAHQEGVELGNRHQQSPAPCRADSGQQVPVLAHDGRRAALSA